VRRGQFLLPKGRAFLNPGSLGVMPRPVMQAVFESLQRGAVYATETVQRWGYEALEPERAEMASFLGCAPEELAFTHNCTEAMGFIAAGLDLKPGDEVVSTNQEHGSGISCWRVKAARSGITLREIDIPVSPRNSGELLDRLMSALGPRTRVLSFSGITSPTGLVMPARELCEAARARGVITVLDGAHMDGQMPVNLRELGCDYFAGSPHKWLFAPAGCGLLYGRPEALDRLWPTVASSGWDNKTGLKAARFMMVGTNNRATIDGMIAGLRFLKALGEEAVYARQQDLAAHALTSARQRSYLEVVTPEDPRLHRAMISLRFKADPPEALWSAMRHEDIGVIGGQRPRLSFHVHTRKSDIDRFFGVCDRILRA
jgi:selenocysteine lyase/cysteine desulfurase